MKEALYYKKLKDKVQCVLCPRNCIIEEDMAGFCGVRKNIKNKLYSLVYAKPISVAIDSIEKKPLYHFLPGTKSFSIGTVGCNLSCQHCQNWQTSQAKPEQYHAPTLEPKQLVEKAIKNNCKSISYTYNEPLIFYEYVLDTAKIAKKNNIKNTMVTNGFVNKEPLEKLLPYMDGANIDLKGFDDKFYRKTTSAWLEPVLDSIKTMHKKIWIEITNLIIPTLNDDIKKIKEMCQWIKDNLSPDVPLHFTAFYPSYKLTNIPPTSADILLKAYDVAKKVGLNYVYVGNIQTDKNNTYCPKCKELLIERSYFDVYKNNIKNGKCSFCEEKIAGIWQ